MAIDDNTSYELTGAQVKDLASKINAKADASSVPAAQVNSDWNANSGVAKILNKPTIPTVNDGTLTIQHNGTTKGTFTANQSTASTVNIETIYADTPSTAANPTGWVNTTELVDGAVTAAKTSFGGNYSTSEVDTGFTWIDGKHIYKKTISFGTLPNSTTKSVAHGISNLDMIVDSSFVAKSSSYYITIPAPSTSSLSNNVVWYISGTNINCSTGSNQSSYTESYVTLWYTKTN